MLKCEFIGEAMRFRKFLFVLIFIPYIFLGQDISTIKNELKPIGEMSDVELRSYWDEAQKRGYSIDQIKTIARAQGASELDITNF